MRLSPQWHPEVISRGVDRNYGVGLYQLTSAARISHNIYCEERYTSTDGRRIAFLRGAGDGPEELWVFDADNDSVTRVSESIHGFQTSNLFSDALFYVRPRGESSRVLMRLDLATFEHDEICDLSESPRGRYLVCTVSPDERYFVGAMRVKPDVWGLYRVELKSGAWGVFHEHKDICNPHPQFEPSRGRDILIQHNRGTCVDEQENFVRLVGEEGATLYVIDADGGNLRRLPVGKPHTGPVTGHECWVGRTGQIIFTTDGPNRNSIMLVKPGDERARMLCAGLHFNHISASSDGRYWVSDDFRNGRLYVGSVETGRMLPLCDTSATCGHPQYSHTHAYMTPGNRRVIFNSDTSGLAQVWSADVPPEFLAALDVPQA